MSKITIRQLNEDDAHDFQELRLRGLREHPESFGSTHERESAYTMEFVAGRLLRAAESPDNFTLGAYLKGKLIGVVGFIRFPRDIMGHRGEIWGMYVVSEEQGKGVGRSLMTDALDRARALPGLEQIELEVASSSIGARRLYESLGFESVGVSPRARVINGKYVDEERMVLFLNRRPRS